MQTMICRLTVHIDGYNADENSAERPYVWPRASLCRFISATLNKVIKWRVSIGINYRDAAFYIIIGRAVDYCNYCYELSCDFVIIMWRHCHVSICEVKILRILIDSRLKVNYRIYIDARVHIARKHSTNGWLHFVVNFNRLSDVLLKWIHSEEDLEYFAHRKLILLMLICHDSAELT